MPSPGRLGLCPPAPIAADGYVDIKVLGRFTLKGVPGLAVLADALPRRLRKRSFAVPGGLVEPCPPDCIPSHWPSVSAEAGSKLKQHFGSEQRKVSRASGSKRPLSTQYPHRDSLYEEDLLPNLGAGRVTGNLRNLSTDALLETPPKASFGTERTQSKLGLGANLLGRISSHPDSASSPSRRLQLDLGMSTRTDADELAAV